MAKKQFEQDRFQDLDSRSFDDIAECCSELQRFRHGIAFIYGVRQDLQTASQVITRVVGEDATVDHVDPKEDTAQKIGQSGRPNAGRFEIRRLVGEGGFAEVYLAYDPSLNREVALKILKPAPSAIAESHARFQREARAAATLSHPGIVPVFDVGVTDERPYIVSAFCDGPTLAEWVDRQKSIDFKSAARILVSIANAVHYAHQRGIIHRDLKPANVLLESASDELAADRIHEKVRISDFGLAKFNDDVDQLQTTEGAIVGTPAFMSPEQAEGNETTTASDIYSIGVIIYQLLTSKLPFVGETHLKTMYLIANEDPESPRVVNAVVPKPLEAICLKCLNKDPGQRYTTAFDLADDLEAWLAGRPVEAALPNSVERFVSWCRRNPLLTVFGFLMLMATGMAALQWHKSQLNKSLADVESRRAVEYRNDLTELVDEFLAEQSLDQNNVIPPNQRKLMEELLQKQTKLVGTPQSHSSFDADLIRKYRRIIDIQVSLDQVDEALLTAKVLMEKLNQNVGREFHDKALFEQWFRFALSFARHSKKHGTSGEAAQILDYVWENLNESGGSLEPEQKSYYLNLVSSYRNRFGVVSELPDADELTAEQIEEFLLGNHDIPLMDFEILVDDVINQAIGKRLAGKHSEAIDLTMALKRILVDARENHVESSAPVLLRLALRNYRELRAQRHGAFQRKPKSATRRALLLDAYRYEEYVSDEPLDSRLALINEAETYLHPDLEKSKDGILSTARIHLRKAHILEQMKMEQERDESLSQAIAVFDRSSTYFDDYWYRRNLADTWRKKIHLSYWGMDGKLRTREELLELLQRCQVQTAPMLEKPLEVYPFRMWQQVYQKSAWANADLGRWAEAFAATGRWHDIVGPDDRMRTLPEFRFRTRAEIIDCWMEKNGIRPNQMIQAEVNRLLDDLEDAELTSPNFLKKSCFEHFENMPRFKRLRDSLRG